ncbi:hypothetical protein FHG68_09855 [Leptospira weilii]|nr:hypothetical protein FHG68_09855 [Leptospira weilii]
MICGDSRILKIDLQSSNSDSFQKNESWISYAKLRLFMNQPHLGISLPSIQDSWYEELLPLERKE